MSDLDHIDPRRLYKQIYVKRGRTENYIKDHKRYLRSDKMSCHRFEASQFRLMIHSLAYILFDTLRREVLRGTELATATIETLRLKVVKLAARIRELKTRIKVELPSGCPVRGILQQSFARLVFVPPG